MNALLDVIWGTLTGSPYYTGQRASVERGAPPSVTSGVAYAHVSEQVRHELWLRAKATDPAGRAAIAARLAELDLMPRGAAVPVPERNRRRLAPTTSQVTTRAVVVQRR